MIFLSILRKQLKIDLSDFTYQNHFEEYLETKVSNETCFKKDKDNKTNIFANEKTKYDCRVLLQVQSVYYSMNNKDDIVYYPQVLLEQYGYRLFSNNKLIHSDVIFTDTEPDSESNDSDESEEEINQNTVFD